MAPIHVAYEMTDAVMTGAVREWMRALARDWFRPRNLVLVALCAAIAVRGFLQGGHWLGWLAAVPVACYAALFAGWLVARWWLPRAGLRKLAHLPHRRVDVDFTDGTLAFATATERLEVAWSEVVEIRELPGCWLFCLRAGAKLPVPAGLLAGSTVAAFRARAAPSSKASHGAR
ncbi:MAG: hypothetical protein U1F58_03600 [Burkholderiales bacterium]